jgi:hypothetical protein
MSDKKAKGLRKQYRKDVQYFLENGGLYELFELIIKPKPRFVPKWVWMLGMRIFINVQEDSDNAGKRTVDK